MKEMVMELLVLIGGVGFIATGGFLLGYVTGKSDPPQRVYQPQNGPPRPLP